MVIDMMPIQLLLIIYLLYFKQSFNWCFLTGLLLVIVAKYVHIVTNSLSSVEVILNALSYLMYVFVLYKIIQKLSISTILATGLVLIAILLTVFLTFDNSIAALGTVESNIYALCFGLFVLISLGINYHERSVKNKYLLLTFTFALITTLINIIDLNNHSFLKESVINVCFLAIHFFMFMYVTKQSEYLKEAVVLKSREL